jgi:Pyruvate/2-oxoacid:ferredoxin oxidoreductase gamma subunit
MKKCSGGAIMIFMVMFRNQSRSEQYQPDIVMASEPYP